MSLTLYCGKSHVNAGTKVDLVAKFLEIPLEYNRIPMKDTKTPEHLKRHPLGKVPVLETPEGFIFQSHAIIRYLARKAGKLYGNSPAETAQIDQWLEFSHTQISPYLSVIVRAVFGYAPVTKENYAEGKKNLVTVLQSLESRLKENEFLGGKTLSVADIVIASNLRYAFSLVFDEKIRASIPTVTKWFVGIIEQKPSLQYFGKTWLCQKQFSPEFNFVKKEEPKKEAKKPQQKKEQPKKDKKKKEEDEEELDETQLLMAAEKKQKNPLDELPKSSFVLDDFKRDFVNAEDKQEALKRFWANYEPQGWSLWKSEYILYEGEGKVGYLTCNLKNGFLRNLDHFRKYCFSVLGVYGEEGNYVIHGAWLWRGTQIPNQWIDHNSFDYFKFEKLDHTNEAHRKTIEEYWLNVNQGKVEGREVFEAKWFK